MKTTARESRAIPNLSAATVPSLTNIGENAVSDRPAPLPADIYPDSRNRLPLVKREDLDADGRAIFDGYENNPLSLAGLQGPGGIRLHSPQLCARSRPVNRYLRYEAGLDRGLVELCTLIGARAMDQRFEWYQHEAVALKEGLDPAAIDVVRYHKPIAGIGEQEAALIGIGREAFTKHAVASETFAAARRLFSNAELVNYLTIIAEYAATAVLLHAFDMQLPDGAEINFPIPTPSGS
jgi:4-carboxymuconolactone decarboxylase